MAKPGWLEMADWSIVVTRDVMGEDVVYNGQPIRALFDDAYELLDMIVQDNATGVQPMLAVRLADLSAPPSIGDTFTVRGQDYEVVDVQNDGHGAARLMAVEVATP